MMRAVFSCRESAALASRLQEGGLPWRDRVALKLHLMMCSGCRVYTEQIRNLGGLFRKRAKQNQGLISSQQQLDPDSRARILSALEKETQD